MLWQSTNCCRFSWCPKGWIAPFFVTFPTQFYTGNNSHMHTHTNEGQTHTSPWNLKKFFYKLIATLLWYLFWIFIFPREESPFHFRDLSTCTHHKSEVHWTVNHLYVICLQEFGLNVLVFLACHSFSIKGLVDHRGQKPCKGDRCKRRMTLETNML